MTYTPIAPNDVATFDMNWKINLGNTSIANVVNIVISRDDGATSDLIVVGSPTISGNTTVIYHLSGGTLDHVYGIDMTVTTSDGETLTRGSSVVCKRIRV